MVCVTAPILLCIYGICYVPFLIGKPLATFFKIRFSIWFEESTKKVDLMDSWSVYGFAQKSEKSSFGFGNPEFDFPPKKTHSKYRRFREESFAAHSRFYAWFPRLFDCNITVGAATPLTSKNSLVTKKVRCFGVLLSLFLITESNASITDWSQCLFRSGPCCILHLLLQ